MSLTGRCQAHVCFGGRVRPAHRLRRHFGVTLLAWVSRQRVTERRAGLGRRFERLAEYGWKPRRAVVAQKLRLGSNLLVYA